MNEGICADTCHTLLLCVLYDSNKLYSFNQTEHRSLSEEERKAASEAERKQRQAAQEKASQKLAEEAEAAAIAAVSLEKV